MADKNALIKARRARFEAIAAMGSNDSRLPWIWAVREQEILWLAHDCKWIEAAKGGWQCDQDIRDFLRTYGLLRGQGGKLLGGDEDTGKKDSKRNRRAFVKLAKDTARQLVKGDPNANSEIWQNFGQKFRDKIQGQFSDKEKETAAKNDWFMKSATLKTLWFSAPDIIPMYDRLAKDGLGNLKCGYFKSHGPAGFLAHCDKVLKSNYNAIQGAKAIWGSDYPYDIRLLDKFLWLAGNKGKATILLNFQSTCAAMAKWGERQ